MSNLVTKISQRHNQNRLFEGQWAIVSTYIDGCDVSDEGIEAEVLRAARDGIAVELLSGVWEGVPERSLLLRGPFAAQRAEEIARACSQVAYIVASAGTAECREPASGRILEHFTEMVELSVSDIAAGAENYSVTGRGLAFQLR